MVTPPFVLVGKQRTGSTWIADLLNNHPSIKIFGDFFVRRKRLLDLRLNVNEFPGYYDFKSHDRFSIQLWRVRRYLDFFSPDRQTRSDSS